MKQLHGFRFVKATKKVMGVHWGFPEESVSPPWALEELGKISPAAFQKDRDPQKKRLLGAGPKQSRAWSWCERGVQGAEELQLPGGRANR